MVLVLLTATAACQTMLDQGSQCTVEPGYLDSVKRISWQGGVGVQVSDKTGYVSPIVVRSLQHAIEAELQKKGFVVSRENGADDQADTQLVVALNTRRELVRYESAGSPCDELDCWERIDPGSATRMDIRTIGFLSADVFHLDNPIWRGWVETSLYPKDRDRADDVIARAVPALFNDFPP